MTIHKQRRRWPWVLGLLIAALVGLIASLIGRDIDLPDGLRQGIEARADSVLAGGSVEVGRISLRLDRDLHPWLILRETVLRDARNTQLVQIGTVRVGVSPRGLLFERRALVQDIVLDGLSAEVARDAHGRLQLAFDRRGDAASMFAGGIGGVVDQIDGLRDRPPLAALERLSVEDLSLTITDARAGRSWNGRGAVALSVDAARTTGAVSVTLDEAAGPVALSVAFDSPRDSPSAGVTVEASDVPAALIAAQSPALAPVEMLDTRISARVEVTRSAQGTLDPVALRLAAGAGTATLGEEVLPLQEALVEARFDPGGDRVALETLRLVLGENRIVGRGQILLPGVEDGVPDSAVLQLALRDLRLRPGALYAQPLTFEAADADLRIRRDPLRLDVGQLRLREGDLSLGLSGQVRRDAAEWDLALDLTSSTVAVADVLHLWPERLRPGTRRWLAENVADGRARDLTLGFRKAAGGPPQVATTFAFEAARVRYLKGSPPIEGGAGFASLGAGRFDVSLDAGRVRAAQGGAVTLAGSTLAIPDLARKPARLELDLRTSGTVTASLSLLDAPPLGLIGRTGLAVDVADGRAEVAARIGLPLKPGLRGPDIDWQARGQVTGVQSTALVPGRRLEAAALDFAIDKDRLTIEGPARLDGVALRGSYAQGIGPNAARPRIIARAEVTPAALRSFGIALPEGLWEGAGQVDLALDLPAGGAPRLTATSDLGGVRMAIPAIGWSKGAGTRGALSLAATLGSTPQVERLSLSAPGLDVRGSVRLGTDGLEAATFERVRVADWFEGPVTLTGRGAGQSPGVRIGGGTLDLAAAELGGGGGGSGSGGSPLDVRLDALRIADGLALSGFSGQFDTTGGLRGRFEALFNGVAPIQGEVSPQDGRTAVHIGSDDAGAVLRAGDFLRGALGGTFDLTLLPAPGEGAYDGTLAIRSLRVRDAPGIAALLDAISVVGLIQQLDGQGLAFDTVDAQFRLSRGAVTVTQSSAVGPGLGISLDGIYGLGAKRVDFQGVVSPFYVLNGLGSFLTRRGEGLIGFNFTVEGPAASPQVRVNPLSLFTPGMFREIFRRPPPEVPN